MLQLRVPASFALDDLVPVAVDAPPAPGDGQVLVRMEAVSLNRRDVMVATGHDRWRPPLGRVPGSDGVGTVVAAGADVTRFRPGDRVLTTILPNWLSGPLTEAKRQGGLGGPAADGVLSELVLLRAEALVRAPSRLSPAEAATLPTAGLTAWHALTRAGALRPGATILTEGTGGVALFALQLGLAAGARVFATSSSAGKIARLTALGATGCVNYRERPDWAEAVVALTGGTGVDVAVDIGGATSLASSIRATAMGGTVSVVGLVGGLDATIDLAEVLQKNLRLDGIETGSRTMLEEMIDWITDHDITPVIDRIYPFDRSADAFRRLASGDHMGKVCILF